MAPRWEGDDRGHGIGSGTELLLGATELVAAFAEPEWVAEQPELHLLPHIEAWCGEEDRLELLGAHADGSAYVLEVKWHGPANSVGAARATVFSLIGSFAESATYVRQRRIEPNGDEAGMKLQFEVGTGELAPDARFDPHGHVVVINVAGVFQ